MSGNFRHFSSPLRQERPAVTSYVVLAIYPRSCSYEGRGPVMLGVKSALAERGANGRLCEREREIMLYVMVMSLS